jgi:hypothetical protein
VPFEMFSLVDLGCLGLCYDEQSICMLVGGRPTTPRVLLYGRWCLCAFCSVFGLEGNE